MMDFLDGIVSGVGLLIILPIVFLGFLLTVGALISCIRQEETRNLPKAVWIIIILVFSTVGPILYFILGRQND